MEGELLSLNSFIDGFVGVLTSLEPSKLESNKRSRQFFLWKKKDAFLE